MERSVFGLIRDLDAVEPAACCMGRAVRATAWLVEGLAEAVEVAAKDAFGRTGAIVADAIVGCDVTDAIVHAPNTGAGGRVGIRAP